MQRLVSERLKSDWQSLVQEQHAPHLNIITSLVEQHSAELARYFYANMLSDDDASTFLSHDEVKQRLSKSLQRWLINLFQVPENYDLDATLQQQVKVGEVHARIKLPIHLVLRGARCLKKHFAELLQEQALDPATQVACFQLYSDLIDIAMELMSLAYTTSTEAGVRSEEIYRMYSIAQNSAAERERQKAALLNWENKLMFQHTFGSESGQPSALRLCEFGLWFHHKGAHAFADYKETKLIEQAITEIDSRLGFVLSEQQSPTEKLEALRFIRSQTQAIQFHLDELFTRSSEMDHGRDVLTHLLNRKFLPTVMMRQIAHARAHNSRFAAVIIDLDYFKSINDEFGHEAGDSVLQQVSQLLMSACRSSDFVFRMGGEEFLVVLVDIEEEAAFQVAEKLRKLVAKEKIHLPENKTTKVTASLGLTLYSGHPDYQVILREADKALYQAKNNGRNSTVIYSKELN
ncbi:diguanylate cyclase [Aliidiomarina taiwanensis]|uniref:Diguanylate cyclase DosC n=1 Tax=Aliidiomarina taiwanensis TaxID=946228 RepID=A0A432X114_9GAMM|nr:diguanylate cyclase [Aliidiomarina taiwanensis]RUO39849.1 diguanylate cyclase [Aliidiomarina taiwanensis]